MGDEDMAPVAAPAGMTATAIKSWERMLRDHQDGLRVAQQTVAQRQHDIALCERALKHLRGQERDVA